MLCQSSRLGSTRPLSSSHWLEADLLQGQSQALAMALLAIAYVRVAVAWGICLCDDGCSVGQIGKGVQLRALVLVVSQGSIEVADGLRVDAGGGDDALGRGCALHARAANLVLLRSRLEAKKHRVTSAFLPHILHQQQLCGVCCRRTGG